MRAIQHHEMAHLTERILAPARRAPFPTWTPARTPSPWISSDLHELTVGGQCAADVLGRGAAKPGDRPERRKGAGSGRALMQTVPAAETPPGTAAGGRRYASRSLVFVTPGRESLARLV